MPAARETTHFADSTGSGCYGLAPRRSALRRRLARGSARAAGAARRRGCGVGL